MAVPSPEPPMPSHRRLWVFRGLCRACGQLPRRVGILSGDTRSLTGMTTYWMNTVSRGHVTRGVAGGFTQANHGKPHMLRRMARDDWIVFYSPKTDYPHGDPLQAFTAIGRVADDEVYQEDFDPQFQPWRRRVEFLPCTETPIRPLIDELDFIENKAQWGFRFRSGVFKIDARDFAVIRAAMTGVPAPPGATLA